MLLRNIRDVVWLFHFIHLIVDPMLVRSEGKDLLTPYFVLHVNYNLEELLVVEFKLIDSLFKTVSVLVALFHIVTPC